MVYGSYFSRTYPSSNKIRLTWQRVAYDALACGTIHYDYAISLQFTVLQYHDTPVSVFLF